MAIVESPSLEVLKKEQMWPFGMAFGLEGLAVLGQGLGLKMLEVFPNLYDSVVHESHLLL